MNSTIVISFGSVIVLVGIALLAVNVYFLYKNIQVKKWLQTKGTIISSSIEISKSPINKKYDDCYRPSVSYNYIINNISFISNRIYFGDKIFTSFSLNSEGIIEKFPIGKSITVYYNPVNQEEATLTAGIKLHQIIYALVSITTIIMGILILFNNQSLVLFIISLE